jgi:hypothetical protein
MNTRKLECTTTDDDWLLASVYTYTRRGEALVNWGRPPAADTTDDTTASGTTAAATTAATTATPAAKSAGTTAASITGPTAAAVPGKQYSSAFAHMDMHCIIYHQV